MTTKLELLKATLTEGELDRHFFEIVSAMDVSDWCAVLSDQDTYKGILPYLIYTYDEEKMDEVEMECGEVLGQALAVAWFEVYHGNTHDKDSQPSISDLGGIPCIVPLLTGHILKKIDNAGYDKSFNLFISQKYGEMIADFVTFADSVSPSHLKRVIFGTVRNDPRFPMLSDYSSTGIGKLTEYAYLVSSIQYVVDLIGLNELGEDECADIIAGLDSKNIMTNYRGIMAAAGFGETKTRRNLKRIVDVEEFIVAKMNGFEGQFSSMTLIVREQHYLTHLYVSGRLSTSCEDPSSELINEQEENAEEVGVLDFNLELNLDSGDYNGPKNKVFVDKIGEGGLSVFCQGIFKSIASIFSNLKGDAVATDRDKPLAADKSPSSSSSLDELIISSTAKKRGFNPAWVLIIFAGVISWGYSARGHDDESVSFIDQKMGDDEASQFPIVKIHNK